jgi:hypothetical protein
MACRGSLIPALPLPAHLAVRPGFYCRFRRTAVGYSIATTALVPTARLFRQKEKHGWADVIVRVSGEEIGKPNLLV